MQKPERKENFGENKKDLSQCPVCEVSLHPEEGFVCPHCKKGPLCRKHPVSGTKECVSCLFGRRKKELQALAKQEMSITQFLKLIFIVFAIYFVALKCGLGQFMEILQESVFARYLRYHGITPVAAGSIIAMTLYNPQGKIADADLQLRKLDNRG